MYLNVAKSVLILLGLTTAASATHAVIIRKCLDQAHVLWTQQSEQH